MRKAIYPIITMVLILLAGCTFAFRTSVTAMIDIDQTTAADTDIFVFAFFSKDARDKAYEAFKTEANDATEFDSYLYDCYSIQDKLSGIAAAAKAEQVSGSIIQVEGIAATMTIEWETKSPDFGEDYDSPYLYFLAAGANTSGSGDQACYIGTCDAKIHSGSSGSVSIRLEKVTNP